MVRLNVAIVAVALSASTVLAYPSTTFFRRQGQIGNAPPEQCATQCQGLASALQANPDCTSDISCLCSAQVADSLPTCVPCIANADPTIFPDGPDVTIQQYNAACAAVGGASSGVVSSTVSGSASVVPVSSTRAVSSAAAASSTKASAAGSSSTGKASSGSSTSTSSGSTASQTGAGVASTQKNILAVFAAVILGAMTAL